MTFYIRYRIIESFKKTNLEIVGYRTMIQRILQFRYLYLIGQPSFFLVMQFAHLVSVVL